MGQVYMLRGLADKALSAFKRAVELDINDSATHYNLALIYAHKKEWGKAVREYRRVVEEDPGDCDALYGEAFALDGGGYEAEALRGYTTFIESCKREATFAGLIGKARQSIRVIAEEGH
jgi:tetratricopeptide (TPR) repeat protein